jgi:hypothetical protein
MFDYLKKKYGKIVSNDGEEGVSVHSNEPFSAEELGIIVNEEMKKEASYKLSNNVSDWNKEIIKQLHNNREWLDVDNFYIRWKSDFDGEKGYALGTIVLINGNKEISVPIVIKDYQLEPFDVFFGNEESKIVPLTKYTINQAFFDTGMAEEAVDKKKHNRSPINDIFPPRMGKYVYASMEVSEEDQADFYATLKNRDTMAIGNSNKEFVKIAKDILQKEASEIDRYYEEKEKRAFLITSDDTLGYKTTWLDDGLKTKVASFYDTMELLKTAADEDTIKEKLKEVDEGKEVTINNKVKTKGITDKDLDSLNIVDVDRSTPITTQDKHGNKVKGYAIPKVYSLQTGKVDRGSLLVDSERNITAYDSKIIGIPDSGNLKDIKIKNVIQMPTRDSVISFMWRDRRHNDFVATQPARIIDYEEVEGVGTIYTVMTTFGSYHKIFPAKNLIKPDFSETNKYNAIMIPGDAAMLIRGDKDYDLVQNIDDFKKGFKKKASVLEGEYFKNSNEVKIKTASVEKIASPNEVRLQLIEEGFDPDKATEFVKEAMNKKTKMYYTKEMEKTANKEKILEDITADVRSIRHDFDLVKIAASLNDPETIDKVLSLNFINKKNLARIFEALPKMKETVEKLAELLLYSRIGEVGMSEDGIADAMKALQNLIEKLEGYQL